MRVSNTYTDILVTFSSTLLHNTSGVDLTYVSDCSQFTGDIIQWDVQRIDMGLSASGNSSVVIESPGYVAPGRPLTPGPIAKLYRPYLNYTWHIYLDDASAAVELAFEDLDIFPTMKECRPDNLAIEQVQLFRFEPDGEQVRLKSNCRGGEDTVRVDSPTTAAAEAEARRGRRQTTSASVPMLLLNFRSTGDDIAYRVLRGFRAVARIAVARLGSTNRRECTAVLYSIYSTLGVHEHEMEGVGNWVIGVNAC